MQKAVDHIRKVGLKPKRIAVEFGFLPYDASQVLRAAFPDAEWVDALFVLERQRAKKSAEELKLLKYASEAVIDSMKAVIAASKPGITKDEVVEALRREETNRGLTFEYCLITCGTSLNRAPSDQKWEKGDIMSIDSGGNYHGYIGDVCRMAIQGEPDAELEDLLGEIETIQRAAMKPITRRRASASEIYAAGDAAGARNQSTTTTWISSRTAWAWSATRRRGSPTTARCLIRPNMPTRPLEAGMVVSVETTLHASDARLHQARGHGGGHRHRPRGLRRGRARLEQGGAGIVWLIR